MTYMRFLRSFLYCACMVSENVTF